MQNVKGGSCAGKYGTTFPEFDFLEKGGEAGLRLSSAERKGRPRSPARVSRPERPSALSPPGAEPPRGRGRLQRPGSRPGGEALARGRGRRWPRAFRQPRNRLRGFWACAEPARSGGAASTPARPRRAPRRRPLPGAKAGRARREPRRGAGPRARNPAEVRQREEERTLAGTVARSPSSPGRLPLGLVPARPAPAEGERAPRTPRLPQVVPEAPSSCLLERPGSPPPRPVSLTSKRRGRAWAFLSANSRIRNSPGRGTASLELVEVPGVPAKSHFNSFRLGAG